MKSKVRAAYEQFFIDETLPRFRNPDIEIITTEDAAELCLLLKENLDRPDRATKLLRAFQVDEPTDEIVEVLRTEGAPLLLELEPKLIAEGDPSKGFGDDRLFLLKLLAMYGTTDGAERVVAVAKSGYAPEAYLWTVIFGCFASEHPETERVFSELSADLPSGFAGVALLDAANQCAIGGAEFRHPFDSQEGVERLRGWLRDLVPEHFSYAHSATVALPFLSEGARDELLQLAMDHPDPGVSVEAAWAAAKMGMERGIRELAQFATNVNTAAIAIHYLKELDRADAIPAAAQEPDFAAMAEMANWLSHPNEFGEAPANITLYDSRELFWPQTNDARQVWLFRYEYLKSEHREADDIGLGMVGSTTFALFGETTAELAPLEAYALHCCWELEHNDDARAPKKRSIAAGLRILAESNDLPELSEAQIAAAEEKEGETAEDDVSTSGGQLAEMFAALLDKAKERQSAGDSARSALKGAAREVMEEQIRQIKSQAEELRAHLVTQRRSLPVTCTATRPGSTAVLQRAEIAGQRAALESTGYQLEGVFEFEKIAGFSLVLFSHPEDGTIATISCGAEITTEFAAYYADGQIFCVRDKAAKAGMTAPPWISYRYEPGRSVGELVEILQSSRPRGHERKTGREAADELAASFRRTQVWRLERGGWTREEVQAQMGIADAVAQADQLDEGCLNVREKWLFAWFKENHPELAESLLEGLVIVHDELDSSILLILWVMSGGSPEVRRDKFESERPRTAFGKVNESQGTPLKLVARKSEGYPADFYASEIALALNAGGDE